MKVDSTWKPILHSKLYKEIIEYLKEEKYIPDKISLLKPFTYFKPSELRVVILGQAPYSRISSATGLAFSVPKTEKIPETLKNMFKEINEEYGNKYKFTNGDLTKWSSREKILLLNTALTTVEGDYNKHYNFQKNLDILILLQYEKHFH
jgi:uracil-DNA glycosylase